MPNSNYVKGRKKEYKLVHREKELGRIALRSAGSHSPIDVVSIDTKHKIIRMIQAKPNNFPTSAANKLKEDNKEINGMYEVRFSVE